MAPRLWPSPSANRAAQHHRIRGLALAAGVALIPAVVALPATTAPVAAEAGGAQAPALGALSGWTASGGSVAHGQADPAVGGPDLLGRITDAQWSISATAADAVQPGAVYGAHGWLREPGAEGGVVEVQLAGDGWSATSAPLHLGPTWQTFGVTAQVPAGALGGGVLSIVPVSGAAPLGGGTLEIAGATAGPVQPSVVSRVPGTREIQVSQNGGAPTVLDAQGYLYWPQFIGNNGLVNTWADPTTCQADAQILRGAGVNLLQVPWAIAQSPDNSVYLQCADSFWAAGIGLAWLLNEGDTVVPGPEWLDAYEQYIQMAQTAFASHPATYLWIIGNENDSQEFGPSCFFDNVGSACPDGQGNYLETLATQSHQFDPDHLVGTKLCCNYAVMTPGDVPALDFWGIDAYPPSSFGTLFNALISRDSTRPALLTEFGDTHYYCFGLSSYGISNSSGQIIDYACPPGSHDDQQDQATGNTSLWQEIVSNDASPSNPNGAVFGGTTFMYSDLWWYQFNDPFSPVGTDNTHDVDAWNLTRTYPPGNLWAWEWGGSAYAQDQGLAGTPRLTNQAFQSLAQLWQPSVTLPAVSNLVVTPGACQITASWSSATAATGRIDAGAVQIVTVPDLHTIGQNDVLQDNTDYDLATGSPAFSTTHTLTLTGLASSTTYRLVARGFDSIGHGATSPPVEATTTAAGCPSAPLAATTTATPDLAAALQTALAQAAAVPAPWSRIEPS